MSMEGVAAAAGVSKPTLYLRYASKSELVVAVLVHLRIGGAPALTGDLRADLVAQLRHLREVYERTGMSLIGTCLAEEPHLPDLIAELRARSLIPGRQLLRDALVAARDRGEIDPDGRHRDRHRDGDRRLLRPLPGRGRLRRRLGGARRRRHPARPGGPAPA